MKKRYLSLLSILALAFNAQAQDPTTAITPTTAETDVISAYSNTYTPNSRISTVAVNTSRASATYIDVSGNNIIKYSFKAPNPSTATTNYSQTEFSGANLIDATNYSYFHIDIYNPLTGGSTLTNLQLKLVDWGADGLNGNATVNADNKEGQVNLPTPAPGQWASYNIPLANFGANLAGQRSKIGAMLITSTASSDLYVDNIYFSTSSTYTTLPLTLISFTGKQSATGAELNWTTASEENFMGFEIEHRTDNTEFTALPGVFIAGGKSNYTFTDKNPATGNNYYRLKRVDNDGTFEYSENVVIIRFGLSTDAAIVSFYPNPVGNELNINYNTYTYGETSFTLSDVQGKVLKKQTLVSSIGSNSAQLNTTDLEKGVYILNIIHNGAKLSSQKIIK